MGKEHLNITKECEDWIRNFAPISIYEYIEIKENEYLDNINFSKSLFEKTESSPERLYRIATQGKIKKKDRYKYPFFREGKRSIRGLPEILEQMVERLYTSSLSFKSNQIPIILLVGPTGGGKTEMGRILEQGFTEELYENPRYTFEFKEINGKKNVLCPFTEDPINLFTSSYLLIPRSIKEKFSQFAYNELCPFCREKLEKIMREKSGETTNYLELLNKNINVVRLQPKVAMVELASDGKKFSRIFKNALQKSNRGILHVNIDDRILDKIPSTNYQLMLSLADRKISLGDGSYFTPDIVVLLYANEKILESLDKKPVLRDRILPVYMRRNLSYSEEEKIFKKMGLPFKHITPGGLRVLAKFSVGSRVHDASDITALRNRLEIFEKNELFQELTEKEKAFILERLPQNDVPKDGWSRGFSTRASIRFLYTITNEPDQCLTLEEILKFLEEIKPIIGKYTGTTYSKEPPVYLLSKKLVDDIAFRDTALAFTAITLGSINKVEEKFSQFINLMKLKYLKKKEKIIIPGSGEIPIEAAMRDTLKKINLDPKKVEVLEAIINKHMQDLDKKPPTYGKILTLHPGLITGSESAKNYIQWQELSRGGLSKSDEEKVKKLLMIMKELGYEEDCGEAALRIASQRIGKIKEGE